MRSKAREEGDDALGDKLMEDPRGKSSVELEAW